MICAAANSLWLAGCVSELARFRHATSRVAEEQQEVLRRILDTNAGTEFGRAYGFSSIRSPADYQARVPLRDFDQHRPWIERAAAGDVNVLTRERIRLFEPTSGSSGATKLIPYTRSLQREFQRGIRAWIADLFTHYPGLMGGRAYWSVSPVTGDARRTAGGIAIGFDDDTSYVGGWQKGLVNAAMAVPGSVRLASDIDAFQYATLFHLARARDLRLISIWNPTFLRLLLDRLPDCGDRICRDLARADARRSREVQAAIRARTPQETYATLWPKLGMISCWQDANAATPAAELAALLPHSRVQGKGLIATEAFVSFPLVHREGAALAVRSHFFEFLSAGRDRPQLAHELERGGLYSVVVTTGGGLYRYALGDQIEVTGQFHGCPLVRFAGRQGYVSDWFGEKLTDAHVTGVFEESFRALRIAPGFAMLACDTTPPAGYVLYIDSTEPDDRIDRAAEAIDDRLRENYHYNYARQLGQLARVRALRVRDGAETYLAHAMRNGQKPGDVKTNALDRRGGWADVFGERMPTP